MKITMKSEEFLLELDDEKVDSFKFNNEVRPISDLDIIIQDLAIERGIEIKKIKISNKYLRQVIKRGDEIYHILEKPAGIYNMDCRDYNGEIKTITLNIPNTVMIVKMTYKNGKYIRRTELIFHTEEPVKQDLSNKIYAWGVSNVYEDFRICWGQGKLPNIDNNSSYFLLDEFFGSIKNRDLIQNKNLNWEKMQPGIVYDINLKDVKQHNRTIQDLLNLKTM